MCGFGCITSSHIFCEIRWDKLPWYTELITYPSALLCIRHCREFAVIMIKIFLARTWDHPWCSTWVLEIWPTIECCKLVIATESEFDDHYISLFWLRNMLIGLIIESCCCNFGVGEYWYIVLCHIKSTTIRRPETGGNSGHTMKLRIVYVYSVVQIWKKKVKNMLQHSSISLLWRLFACNYTSHNIIEVFFICNIVC